jgi:hypothetical protein
MTAKVPAAERGELEPVAMSAEETLALGQATLKAAFSPEVVRTTESEELLNEAFRLRNKSVELGNLELNTVRVGQIIEP